MKVTIYYDAPIKAPIQEGDQIAKLVLTAPDTETREIPLVAGASVERKGLFGRIGATFSYLVTGEP